MKYSSIFSMLSFFILFACNETAVYGSDENIIFMRYVEKLHLDKYSVKEGANKQVISSQADSLIKISRIWADFFPANTSNQPI